MNSGLCLPHLVQNGKVVCQQVSCPPVSCINPSFIDGECCPVCLSEFGLSANFDLVLKKCVLRSEHLVKVYQQYMCV